jgi:hypothetical protein
MLLGGLMVLWQAVSSTRDCGDWRADNYSPSSTSTASENHACNYSCAGLARSLGITGALGGCFIEGGGDDAWPPPLAPENGTHTARGLWSTTVVQGRAAAGGGRFSALAGRADAVGGASLVLRHVEMAGLAAISQPSCYGGFSCGGAVFVSGGGNLTVEHALLTDNRAGNGADGGAIKVIAGGAVVLRSATFHANSAHFGGAINVQGCGSVEITRCVLAANVAVVAGGALRANLGGPGAPAGDLQLTASQCSFMGNLAGNATMRGAGGGALSLVLGSPKGAAVATLLDCRGAGNAAATGAAVFTSTATGGTKRVSALSEADVLLGTGAPAGSRWALVSFSAFDATGSCGVPALPLQHAVAGSGNCPHGPGAIFAGSSCTPAVCATANIAAAAAAVCSEGTLLWKGGCACAADQHNSPDNLLPDAGICV